ncbi:hypothetical protein SPAN111604_05420 [Sphingomonas antarctica]
MIPHHETGAVRNGAECGPTSFRTTTPFMGVGGCGAEAKGRNIGCGK